MGEGHSPVAAWDPTLHQVREAPSVESLPLQVTEPTKKPELVHHDRKTPSVRKDSKG